MDAVKHAITGDDMVEFTDQFGKIIAGPGASDIGLPDGQWSASISLVGNNCLHGAMRVWSDEIISQEAIINFSYGVMVGKWTRKSSPSTVSRHLTGYVRHKIDSRLCFQRTYYMESGELLSFRVRCLTAEGLGGQSHSVSIFDISKKADGTWPTDDEAAEHVLGRIKKDTLGKVQPLIILEEFICPPGDIMGWLQRGSYQFADRISA